MPEHQLLNGELRRTLSKELSGAAYIPKANSNNSNRIKAAYVAFQANDFRNNQYFKRRALRKGPKQIKHLFHVGTSLKSIPEEFMDR